MGIVICAEPVIMNADQLKSICLESCREMYSYLERKQQGERIRSNLIQRSSETGRSVINITDYQLLSGGHIKLQAESKIFDANGSQLTIDGRSFESESVGMEYFDSLNRTITIQPCRELLDLLIQGKGHTKLPKISLITDLKWLIDRTERYYAAFGHMIGYPKKKIRFERSEHQFPDGLIPSDSQREAVDTVLNNPLSYVWGAPGTGKTQFVLATAILAHLRRGERVAVLAPTNSALEQVLRGLLKIIKNGDPHEIDIGRDILRLGVASYEFFSEYPEVCEKRGIAKEIRIREETIQFLKDVVFEKKLEAIRSDFDAILGGSNDRTHLSHIRDVLSGDERYSNLLNNVNQYNMERVIGGIADLLYNRDRPALENDDYRDRTIEYVEVQISKLYGEIEDLNNNSSEVRVEHAKIIAMTPHTMMGRFSPVDDPNYQRISVDHIFLDEAGYCNIMHTLSLYTFGVPVTILGDHKQLPPVCEVSEDTLKDGALCCFEDLKDDQGYQDRYLFMWSQSAIYSEEYLYKDIKEIAIGYFGGAQQEYRVMKSANLTESHRFGDNLAKVLDESVYNIGIVGKAEVPLKILFIDVKYPNKRGRENEEEAKAIWKFIQKEDLQEQDFVILTPYRKQMRCIQENYPQIKDDVTNVHRSQGLEWDTVILSVADNSHPVESTRSGKPYIYSSTVGENEGLYVINTAVSRAKRRLVIVCDADFWINRKDELLGKLIGVSKKYD